MVGIVKVALAGHLGSVVVQQLLNSGFAVTALTRGGSHNFPPSVSVVQVDYNSVDSLTNALKGQDATVATLGPGGVGLQKNLIEASIKAGVKRFIPSEFGSDTTNKKTAQLPVFGGKIAIQNLLKEKAASSGLTYSILFTGAFLDYGITNGVVMDLKNKSIEIFDGGDRPYSTTTTTHIGQAIASILKHEEETKNRAIYVRSAIITKNQLLAMGKKAVGPDGWTEKAVDMDRLVVDAWAELEKPNPNPGVWAFSMIKASVWGEGYGLPFQTVDNELLGIKELTPEELQTVVNSVA
ncbi:hypothetical protein ACHAQJ_002247 [Trichoderma viride]